MKLLLIRHGEDTVNAAGVRTLTAKGKQQSQAAGSWLRAATIEILYWSPMRRTFETVHELGDRLWIHGGPDSRISEIRPGPGPPPRERRASDTEPGFETWSDFLARVAGCITELAHAHQHQTIGLVTHRGVFDAVHEIASGSARRVELAVDHGCITSWTYDPQACHGRWILNFHNYRPCWSMSLHRGSAYSERNNAEACDHLY
ncbi:histidine phosphatase family protein [Nocardia sp. NPDC051570]|uniref:histidine phosphatase family protein n=1 Tax=Nocardia sp. NPDC051570 TaxID=3364324 RepID=UPI0037B29128